MFEAAEQGLAFSLAKTHSSKCTFLLWYHLKMPSYVDLAAFCCSVGCTVNQREK